MRAFRPLILAALAALLSAGPAFVPPLSPALAQATEPKGILTQSVRTAFPVAAVRAVDLSGDGAAELLVIGKSGEVRVWRHGGLKGQLASKPVGSLVLPQPDRTLLATADVAGTGGAHRLAALSSDGLTFYELDKDGGFAGPGTRVTARARFRLRVGEPRFARILRDINDDGRPDLLLPGGEASEVWINEGGKTGPRFRRSAVVRTELSRFRSTEGSALSSTLESSFRIPYLTFRDVNGDRRPDLLVIDDDYRAFHIQREDGSVPAEPDVSLDLGIFRDTTPEASIRPGHTLAGGDTARLEMQDLDEDGIPDYVISHRRKIWVFHGTRSGPQFTEPSAILKLADDVSEILVLPLDDDPYPDLMVVRLQVPTIATLLTGLYSEWEVEASSVGYRNVKGRKFAKTPEWRGSARLRLPEIVGALRNPNALIRKLEQVGSKFRDAVTGDLDGDGNEDVAMISEDQRELQVWRAGRPKTEEPSASGIAGLFFGEEEKVLTLDEALSWLAGLAEQRTAELTGGKPPEARATLEDPQRYDRITFTTADIDGDGRREVVVAYRDLDAGGRGLIQVHRLE